jgi:hypothetical protein
MGQKACQASSQLSLRALACLSVFFFEEVSLSSAYTLLCVILGTSLFVFVREPALLGSSCSNYSERTLSCQSTLNSPPDTA